MNSFCRLIIYIGCAFALGCSSVAKIDTTTAEGAFKRAEYYEKNNRFEEALQYYIEVKNKHPYSSFAPESEIKIADIEFNRKNYVEAEAAYKLFKQLHPNHPKMDYVTFRLGQSIFNQLPNTIDRDLSLANSSVLYFNEVLNSYPNSRFAPEAQQNRDRAQEMIFEKEKYIAEFYFKRENWLSALGRYEDLLKITDPKSDLGLNALFHATISAYRAQEMDRAQKYYRELLAKHPKSSELERARKELSGE